LFSIPLP